jgi:hypothetical protein
MELFRTLKRILIVFSFLTISILVTGRELSDQCVRYRIQYQPHNDQCTMRYMIQLKFLNKKQTGVKNAKRITNSN